MPEPTATDRPGKGEALRTTITKEVIAAGATQANLPGIDTTDEKIDAFTYLRNLSNEQWQKHMVYLFWRPFGSRKTGPYIDVITEPITMQQVKEQYGGSSLNGEPGTFLLWINNNDEKWRKVQEFEIEGERKIKGMGMNPANLSSHGPAAASPNLEALLSRLVEVVTQRDPNFQGVMDMQKKAFENTLEAVTSRLGTAKPESGGLLDTLRLMKELGLLAIGKTEAPGGIMETIKVLKELGVIASAGAQNATSDPVKMVEMVSKLAEALKKIAPDNDGGDSWKSGVVKLAGDLVQELPGLTSNYARAAEANARSKAAPASPAQPSPPNPNPTSAASPETPAAPAPPQGVDIQPYLWDRVAQMILTEAEGDQIAQFLHFATMAPDPENPQALTSLIANFKDATEGMVLNYLSQNAAINQALETPNHDGSKKDSFLLAKQFLYFCRTLEMYPEENDDDDPEAPAPPEIPQ